MKADLFSAQARAGGSGGLIRRTAAGFVVLTSDDGQSMIDLIDHRQNEPDLVDQVIAHAQADNPDAFAMLFTAGGDLYVIAAGSAMVSITSATMRSKFKPAPGRVAVHGLGAGLNEFDAVIRIGIGIDGDAVDPEAIAVDSATSDAAWTEVAVGDAAFEEVTGDDTDEHAPDELVAESAEEDVAPSFLDSAFLDSAFLDSASNDEDNEVPPPYAEELDHVVLVDEVDQGVRPEERGGGETDMIPWASGSESAERETAAESPSGAPSAFAAAAMAEVADEAAGATTMVDVQNGLAPEPTVEPPAELVDEPIIVLSEAGEAEVRPAAARPVMVLGVTCPLGHHNHPEAVFCSQCGTKMGAKHTTVLLNGPRPPLGVLVVDDGSTYSLNEDLIIGREPTTHDDIGLGRAAPMVLTDDSLALSRKHARISLNEWAVSVVDLGSSNGTYVSRPGRTDQWSKITDVEVPLHSGDRVRVGGRVIQVELHHAV